MSVFERILAALRGILGAMLLAAIAINIANVAARYIFLSPIVWAEEIMMTLVVWIVCAGAVLVTWKRDHLGVDVLVQSVPRPWSTVLNAAALVVIVGLCLFVAAQSARVLQLFWELDQRSAVAGIPKVVPHAAVLFGFFFIAVAAAIRIRLYLAGSAHPGEEELAVIAPGTSTADDEKGGTP